MPNKKLIVNDNLPKIILPRDKTKLFLDWYKQDLYAEDTVPIVFNEGYFVLDLSDYIKIKTLSMFELDGVKFGMQSKLIDGIHQRYDRAILHYKLLNDTTIQLESYSELTGELCCSTSGLDIGRIKTERLVANIRNAILNKKDTYKDVDEDLIIDIRNLNEATKIHQNNDGYVKYGDEIGTMWSEFSEKWTTTCVYLLISALWYLASSSENQKDDNLKIDSYTIQGATYDNSNRKNKHKPKNKVRNITAPIYNLGFVKELSVNKLISKKRGWKISYEFQVRGHYRHYKSGKVVFIKPFEKGKGLEKKQTIIKLNPVF